MAFINDNLQILATLGSALAVYLFIRMGARREGSELRSEMGQLKAELSQFRFEVRQEFKEVKDELKQIDRRLTRLEGRFDERGYWESREHYRTGTEDKH